MTVDLRSIDIKNFISYMNKPEYDSYNDIKNNGILLIQSILLSGTLDSSELRLALFDREDLSLHLQTYLTKALREDTYFKTSTFNNIIYILWLLVDFVFSDKSLEDVLQGRKLLISTINSDDDDDEETRSLLIDEEMLKKMVITFIQVHYFGLTEEESIDGDHLPYAKVILQLMFSTMPTSTIISLFIHFLKSAGIDGKWGLYTSVLQNIFIKLELGPEEFVEFYKNSMTILKKYNVPDPLSFIKDKGRQHWSNTNEGEPRDDNDIYLGFILWVEVEIRELEQEQEQDQDGEALFRGRGGSADGRSADGRSVDSDSEDSDSEYKEELTSTQLKLQDTYTKQKLLSWLKTQALNELDMTTLNLLYVFGNLLSQMFTRWEYYKQNDYIKKLMKQFDLDKYNFLFWDLNGTFKEPTEEGVVDKVTHSLYNLSCMLALKMSTNIKETLMVEVAKAFFPEVVEYLVPSTNLLESKIQLLDTNLLKNKGELVKELGKLKSIAEREESTNNIFTGEAKLKQDLKTQQYKIEKILQVKLKTLHAQLRKARFSGTSVAIPNCKFSPITKGLPVILLAIAEADRMEIRNIMYKDSIDLLLQFITNLMEFFTNISEFIKDQLDILDRIYKIRALHMKAEGFDTSAEASEQQLRAQLAQLSLQELADPKVLSPTVDFKLDLQYDSSKEKESIIRNIKEYITCQILITFLSFKTDFLKACNLTYIEVLNQGGLVYAYVKINHEILGIPSEFVSLWVSNLIFLVLECAVDVIDRISNNNNVLKGLLCANMLSNKGNLDMLKELILYFSTSPDRKQKLLEPITRLQKLHDMVVSEPTMPYLFALAKDIHLLSLRELVGHTSIPVASEGQDEIMQVLKSFTSLSSTFYPIQPNESIHEYIDRLDKLTKIDQLEADTVGFNLVNSVHADTDLLFSKVRKYARNEEPRIVKIMKADDLVGLSQLSKAFVQTTGIAASEFKDSQQAFPYFMRCSTIFTIKHIEEILVTLFTDLLGQVNICVRIGTANPSLVRPNPEDTDKLQLLQQQIKAMNVQFGIENEFSTQELLHMITNEGVFPVNLEMDYIGSSKKWRHATRSLTTYSYKTAAGICQTGIILHRRKEINEATKTKRENTLKSNQPKRYSREYTNGQTGYASSNYSRDYDQWKKSKKKLLQELNFKQLHFQTIGNFEVYTDTVYCFSGTNRDLRSALMDLKHNPIHKLTNEAQLNGLCQHAIPYYLPVTSVSLMYGQTVLTPYKKLNKLSKQQLKDLKLKDLYDANTTSGFYKNQGEDEADLPSRVIHMTEGLVNVMHQTLSGHTSSIFGYGGSGSGKTYNLLGATRSNSIEFGILQEMVLYGLCKNFYFDISTIFDVYGRVTIFATDQKFKMDFADIAEIPIYGNKNNRQEQQGEFDGYCFANSRTVPREYQQFVFNYQVDDDLSTFNAAIEQQIADAKSDEESLNLGTLKSFLDSKELGPAEKILMQAMFDSTKGKKLNLKTQIRPTHEPRNETNNHLTQAFPLDDKLDDQFISHDNSFCAGIMTAEVDSINTRIELFLMFGILSLKQLHSLKQNILNSLIGMFSMSDEKKTLYDFAPILQKGMIGNDPNHYSLVHSALKVNEADNTVKLVPSKKWNKGNKAKFDGKQDEIFLSLNLFIDQTALCLTYLQFITTSIEIERRTGEFEDGSLQFSDTSDGSVGQRSQSWDAPHFQFKLNTPLRIAPTPNNPESSRSLLCINLKFYEPLRGVMEISHNYGVLTLCDTAGAETLEKLIDSMAKKVNPVAKERKLIVGDYFNFMLGTPIWLYLRDLAKFGLHYDKDLEDDTNIKLWTLPAQRDTFVQPPDWSEKKDPKPQSILSLPVLSGPTTTTQKNGFIKFTKASSKDPIRYNEWVSTSDKEFEILLEAGSEIVIAKHDYTLWDRVISAGSPVILPFEMACLHPFFIMRKTGFGYFRQEGQTPEMGLSDWIREGDILVDVDSGPLGISFNTVKEKFLTNVTYTISVEDFRETKVAQMIKSKDVESNAILVGINNEHLVSTYRDMENFSEFMMQTKPPALFVFRNLSQSPPEEPYLPEWLVKGDIVVRVDLTTLTPDTRFGFKTAASKGTIPTSHYLTLLKPDGLLSASSDIYVYENNVLNSTSDNLIAMVIIKKPSKPGTVLVGVNNIHCITSEKPAEIIKEQKQMGESIYMVFRNPKNEESKESEVKNKGELCEITYAYEKLALTPENTNMDQDALDTFDDDHIRLAFNWEGPKAKYEYTKILSTQRDHLVASLAEQERVHNKRMLTQRMDTPGTRKIHTARFSTNPKLPTVNVERYYVEDKVNGYPSYHQLSCFRSNDGTEGNTTYAVQPDYAQLSKVWEERIKLFVQGKETTSVFANGNYLPRIGIQGPGTDLFGSTLRELVNPDDALHNEHEIDEAVDNFIEIKHRSMPNRKMARLSSVFNAFGAQFMQQFQDELIELLNELTATSITPTYNDSQDINGVPTVELSEWYNDMFQTYSTDTGTSWKAYLEISESLLLLRSLLLWISSQSQQDLAKIYSMTKPQINYSTFNIFFNMSFNQLPYLLTVQINKLIFLMWTYQKCFLYACAQWQNLHVLANKTDRFSFNRYRSEIHIKAVEHLNSIIDSFVKSILNESVYITYSIRDMKEIFRVAQEQGLSPSTAIEVAQKYSVMPKKSLIYFVDKAKDSGSKPIFVEFFEVYKSDWKNSSDPAEPDFKYDISVDKKTKHLMGIASTDDIGKLQPDTSTEVKPPLYCFTDSNDNSKNPQMTLVGHVFTHIYTTTNVKGKCTRFTQLFTVRPEGPFHEEERHYFSTSETLTIAEMLKLDFDG